jgi:rubrerythrin
MKRKRAALHRERERIARAIGAIVFGVTPCAAIAQACSSNADPAVLPAFDGSFDGQGVDVAADGFAEAADASDFDAAACAITSSYFDSGIYYDAEGGGIDLSCVYHLPCGLPPTLVAIGCLTYIGAADGSPDAYVPLPCTIPEGLGCTDGSLTPGPLGELSMTCLDCLGGGRRPRGLRAARIDAKNSRGEYFAKMAHEEGASVFAFERMQHELALFEAPRALRSAARRAIRDEKRHARAMSSLARASGARSTPPRIKKLRERSLEAMAIENAVEGCVNETYGAIVMHWQSVHATDARLRETFRKIADDEMNHAALSWSLAAWAEEELGAANNRRVRRARERAALALARSAAATKFRSGERALGLPTPAERADLIARMLCTFRLI